MQLGFVGQGKMGSNMVRRIERDADARVVVFDLHRDAVRTVEGYGATGAEWLLELAEKAFEAGSNDLTQIRGYAADSGEGRWTVQDGIDENVPMPAIAAALYARFYSPGEGDFAHRFIAALRSQFGGRTVERAIEEEPV